MRLPDRPVLNVVLGVVFALLVLGFLSWPGFVGQKQAPPFLLPASNIPSAGSGQTLSVSTGSSSSSAPANTVTMTSTLSSSATLALAESSSSVPAPSNSVPSSGFSVPSSSFGSTNKPMPVSSPSSPNNSTGASLTSGQESVAGQPQTTMTATALQETITTAAYNFQNSSSSNTSLYAALSSSRPATGTGVFATLGILTFGAVSVAVGSMLFIRRKVDSEDSEN